MDWPVFNVIRVDDGAHFGLLLERFPKPGADPDRAYFHFPPGDTCGSLEPPAAVRRRCACYVLRCSQQLEALFCELAEYTAYAHSHVHMRALIDPTQQHSSGYPKTASMALSDATCPFTAFFGRSPYQTFKESVLAAERGTHKLQGRARLFRVCRPDAIHFVDEDFEYLEPAEHTLRLGTLDQAMWFRKSGPIFKDFDNGYVCRPAMLDEIQRRLLAENVLVVAGARGSGKSVLGSYLAYECVRAHSTPVYYGHVLATVNPAHLACEINAVRGIVILEDVHRFAQTVYDALRRVRIGSDRRILMTARVGMRSRSPLPDDPLAEYSRVCLSVQPTFDQIIACFEAAHSALPNAHRSAIRTLTAGDLWHVAYALLGREAAGARGTVSEWISSHVLRDFEVLEQEDVSFPRILVALAPCAMSSEPTCGTYLTRALGFNQSALVGLVNRGEIRRDVIAGDFFYGLPHPSLAGLYWESAAPYRADLPTYEQCLYNYAQFGAPNSLAVLGWAPDVAAQKHTILRLSAENMLAHAVQLEPHVGSVSVPFLVCGTALTVTKQLRAALLHRLRSCPDAATVCDCVTAAWSCSGRLGQWLLKRIDRPGLAKALLLGPSDRTCQLLSRAYGVSFKLGRALIDAMGLGAIVARAFTSQHADCIYDLLAVMCKHDRRRCRQIINLLGSRHLCATPGRVPDFGRCARAIHEMYDRDPEIARSVCDTLDVDMLCSGSPPGYSEDVGQLVAVLLLVSPTIGTRSLQALLPAAQIAAAAGDPLTLCRLLSVASAVPGAGRALQRQVDVLAMARRFPWERGFEYFGEAFDALYDADIVMARTLLEQADVAQLAPSMCGAQRLGLMAGVLQRCERAHHGFVTALWPHLDIAELARRVCDASDLEDSCVFVLTMFCTFREFREYMWPEVDRQILARRLVAELGVDESIRVFSRLSAVSSVQGRAFLRLLLEAGMAGALTSGVDAESRAKYIARIVAADRPVGEALAQTLAQRVVSEESTE